MKVENPHNIKFNLYSGRARGDVALSYEVRVRESYPRWMTTKLRFIDKYVKMSLPCPNSYLENDVAAEVYKLWPWIACAPSTKWLRNDDSIPVVNLTLNWERFSHLSMLPETYGNN
jgi:hypothetical protein